MFFGSLAYGFFLIKLVSSNILSQNNVVNLSEGKSKFCICNVGNTTVTQKKQINFTNKDVSVIIGVILSIYLVGFVFIGYLPYRVSYIFATIKLIGYLDFYKRYQ
ncbi:uncharacterized protein LOC105846504 isoform X2 [Hydra vulgaris]|uniref:uncharacterized protein LOC105846504 isoform X2 n=1 Tax=Hydra vulgaris TaxID=6087 RepID=UPI001F5F15EF|nr:uncharacterized protein LOC105846504 isoform X2 [Hydra vulgaris]